MGNFSRDTFDRLKHYIGVRMQQGVPIVDADWNELEDIRKYELQTFLKWFVGNGVPRGNDGFRILPADHDNDFVIQGGDGTAEGAGRCIVEGWDVIIEASMAYTGQPLYVDSTLATKWGVDALPPLTTSGHDRVDAVYLDVWEREVNATEDPNLKNRDIGIETSVRQKREWVVRVAEGRPIPIVPANHHYYPVATFSRPRDQNALLAENITDLRLTDLAITSYRDLHQITTDAYGPDYSLDNDGQPNLKVSLRDAINALLRRELPSSPERQVATLPRTEGPQGLFAFKDSIGEIWMFWHKDNTDADQANIWFRRYEATSDIWTVEAQLTTRPIEPPMAQLFALEDSAADIWLFWEEGDRNSCYQILCKRFDRLAGTWTNDMILIDTSQMYSDRRTCLPVKDDAGSIWVFWSQAKFGGTNEIWYKRYLPASGIWTDATQLTTAEGIDVHAVQDATRDIWVFWSSIEGGDRDIWYKRYIQSNASWTNDTRLTSDASYEAIADVLVDDRGDILVFYNSGQNGKYNAWFLRYNREQNTWGAETQLIPELGTSSCDSAVRDSRGDIWVLGNHYRDGSYRLWYKRYARDGTWGHKVLFSEQLGWNTFAVEDANGDMQVFFLDDTSGGSSGVFNRRVILSI